MKLHIRPSPQNKYNIQRQPISLTNNLLFFINRIVRSQKKIEKSRFVSSVDSIREKRTKLVFAFYLFKGTWELSPSIIVPSVALCWATVL